MFCGNVFCIYKTLVVIKSFAKWLTTRTFTWERVREIGKYFVESVMSASDEISQSEFKSIGLYFGAHRRPRQEKHT